MKFITVEVDTVRSINLHTYNSLQFFYKSASGEPLGCTLPAIWGKLATSSSFHQRTEMIQEFNRSNKWGKRGISRVPVTQEVNVRPTPGKVSNLRDGSIVVEVGRVDMGQGLWTKVKQVAAYGLGLIKRDGTEELLEKVRVIQSNTLSLIQGGITGGSTTSESSCEAVRLCCSILVERLTALKEKLIEQTGTLEWETLILQMKSSLQLNQSSSRKLDPLQLHFRVRFLEYYLWYPFCFTIFISHAMHAYQTSVNLSACTLFIPEPASMHYLNYGAAVSEIVLIDFIFTNGEDVALQVEIEGSYVQGIGFFMFEEYPTNSDGLVTANGTWSYKVPTLDTIPKQFNVEILNSRRHQKRLLSSKASGEPQLILAVSVPCATRAAIVEARRQLGSWNGVVESNSTAFQLEVPAIMPVVKEWCGLDSVEKFLQWTMGTK
ncbi:indole-3-acetaldehyde oxidase-like [Hibiscus syriacus]|uniref:indole-3-acetaldehyde oxidase-like n=1 Tax=Hibiscus syriacus TaxID=106335 RepID=UPI001922BA2B|nr:indole-3-acetaldehyde oxidase-like [Hibiscus syriacus]